MVVINVRVYSWPIPRATEAIFCVFASIIAEAYNIASGVAGDGEAVDPWPEILDGAAVG